MKKLALTLTAALAFTTLAACGGNSEADAFCGDQAAINKAFTGAGDMADALKDIKPPSEIKDDWKLFIDSLSGSTTATPEDSTKALAAIQNIGKYIEKNC